METFQFELLTYHSKDVIILNTQWTVQIILYVIVLHHLLTLVSLW